MIPLLSGPGALAQLLVVVGDVLVFVLVALTFRLLSPRRLTGAIWLAPVVHVYTLGTTLLALYLAVPWGSQTTWLGSWGSMVLSGIIGAFLGRAVGRRVPVKHEADGRFTFTGGKLLVALLVVLLLPLALEQAAVRLGSFAGTAAGISTIEGSPPFLYLVVGVGSLFVLGTILSISWRLPVWAARVEKGSSTAHRGGS